FATLLPVLLLYILALGILFGVRPHHEFLQALPQVVEVFVLAALPGLLFVGAFSIACPAFIWPPLYQFLFIGYWFWGNLLSPSFRVPTLSVTILTPIGSYIYAGIFRSDTLVVSAKEASALQGSESILLLLGLAVLAIVSVQGYLNLQRRRQ
ncbi:MAG TPA: hypothetical protein VFN23_20410, partial [Ktedonobacteraceae bacterium]|nr:hypothetical protein [Ktedonobacteraceae bacterium]